MRGHTRSDSRLGRILAMARKEVRQLSRDKRTLAVLLVLPAILLLFYGYVLSFDVRHVRLAVLDRDNRASSRELVEALTSGEYFDVVERLEDESAIPTVFSRNRAGIVLVIPPGFTGDLASGDGAPVQALIDGSDATIAQTALSYVEALVTAIGGRLVRAPAPPVQTRIQVLYNPELASDKFLLPGLMGFILMISSTIATALSVVRERETGTMEQLLVSPLSPLDVVLGKALPYGALAVAAAVVLMTTARVVFGLEIRGNPLLLLFVIVLFVAGAQGLGLLISSGTASQQVAFQAATFATMLPALLLSGFIFPIRSMPVAVQLITFLVPARYFVRALRGIVLKGVGVEVLWPQILALVIFTAVTLGAAVLRLRRVKL